MNEIKIHKSLNHPNIVKFVWFFEDPEHVYVLLELCQPKTLSDLIKKWKRIQEIEVKSLVLQLISAIDYIHKKLRIVHWDIKLGNLFLGQDMNLRLGDFGLAS